MGERLNIEIKENGNVLANAYYHWSGFTSSSLELTEMILNEINTNNIKDKSDSIAYAIKLLDVTGSGLAHDEVEYAKTIIEDFDKYGFNECTGRNDGLTCVSKNGMESTERWEEHRIEINIDTNKIKLDNVIYIYTEEEYKSNYDEDVPKNLVELNIIDDLSDISFEKFIEMKEIINKLIEGRIYVVKMNGKIGSFCE